MIDLGSSGEKLTLQTTEAGGFTRSGEALLITRREDGLYEGNGNVFESGGIVTELKRSGQA